MRKKFRHRTNLAVLLNVQWPWSALYNAQVILISRGIPGSINMISSTCQSSVDSCHKPTNRKLCPLFKSKNRSVALMHLCIFKCLVLWMTLPKWANLSLCSSNIWQLYSLHVCLWWLKRKQIWYKFYWMLLTRQWDQTLIQYTLIQCDMTK